MIAVGLPLSIAGYRNARRHNTGAGTARAGMATNSVAIPIVALHLVFLGEYAFWFWALILFIAHTALRTLS